MWAEDLHELLELAKALAAVRRVPATAGVAEAGAGGLAILTCSGGDSAQGADEATRRGLALPEFAPATCERLRELLPPAATVANPLDYTAMIWGDAAALGELVATVAADPAIGEVLVFYDQPRDLDGASEQSWGAVRDGIIAGAARTDVPVIVSSTLPELLDDAAAWRFASHGIAPVAGLRTGAAVRGRAAARAGRSGAAAGDRGGGGARSRPGPSRTAACGCPSTTPRSCCAPRGVAVPDGRLVGDEDDAVGRAGGARRAARAEAELGRRCSTRRSSAGSSWACAREARSRLAYRRLAALAAEHDGAVLAERMAPGGAELLVAARADTIVPVLVIGLGGIWTELLDDVAIVPLPADAARIERALRSLRGARAARPAAAAGRPATSPPRRR